MPKRPPNATNNQYAQDKKYLNNIKEEDDPQTYALAQLGLGSIFKDEGDTETGKQHWSNITVTHDKEIYFFAQFQLGLIYASQKNETMAQQCWESCTNTQLMKSECKIWPELRHTYKQKVVTFFSSNAQTIKLTTHTLIDKVIEKIDDCVQDILKTSFIDAPPQDDPKHPERKFAHYTTAEVAKSIIKNMGSFQLGVSNYMNDPTEGKVLLEYVHLPSKNMNDLYTFLTSFTFNHNSLNQFRLYGKKDNQGGTGVSLVVNRDLFINKFNPRKQEFISLLNTAVPVKTQLPLPVHQDATQAVALQPPGKQPLFRCIYIHPDSGYVNLAHRSKLSFYLEYGKELNDATINKKWENYEHDNKKKREQIKALLLVIKKELQKINNFLKENEEHKKAHQEEQATSRPFIIDREALDEALNIVLLPITYLTKHAAFEEEAECRMLYIAPISDQHIQMNEEVKRFYVEYETPLTSQNTQGINYLNKVYLGPKAENKLEILLKKLWSDMSYASENKNKSIAMLSVERSTMPLA